MKLADGRLSGEVPERASGAAAEVENALLVERPPLRKALEDLDPGSPPDLVERVASADAISELERRKWRDVGNRDTFGRRAWAIVDSNHGPPPYQSGALTD